MTTLLSQERKENTTKTPEILFVYTKFALFQSLIMLKKISKEETETVIL